MNVLTQFVTELSVFDISGLLGFAAYLGGFASLQFGFLDGNGKTYAWVNILAASLVLISLYEAFNLASLLIQVSWIIIGYFGIVRHRRQQETIGRSFPA